MSRAATARRFRELFELQNGLYSSETERAIAALKAFAEEMRGPTARLHISRGVFPAPGLPPALQSFTAYVGAGESRSIVGDASAAERILHRTLDARFKAGPCKAYSVVTYNGSGGPIPRRTKTIAMPTLQSLYLDFEELNCKMMDDGPRPEGDSAQQVDGIGKVEAVVSVYAPFGGEGYKEIPSTLAGKKCLVNVKNWDDRCFLYAVASVVWVKNRTQHPNSPYAYTKHLEEFNTARSDFPMSVSDIPTFVKDNVVVLGGRDIDVYETEGVKGKPEAFKKPWPLRVSALKVPYVEPIRLLLFEGHYMGIRPDSHTSAHEPGSSPFQRLFSSDQDRRRVCPRCLTSFHHHYDIAKHQENCEGYEAVQVQMPKAGDCVEFKGPVAAQIRSPIALYADFESVLTPTEDAIVHDELAIHGAKRTQTIPAISKHEAISYRMRAVVPEGCQLTDRDWTYTGPNAAIHFITLLKDLQPEIMMTCFPSEESDFFRPCERTVEVEEAFQNATSCYLCGEVSRIVESKDDLRDWLRLAVETNFWPGTERTMTEEERELWEEAADTVDETGFNKSKYKKLLPPTIAESISEHYVAEEHDDPWVRDHCLWEVSWESAQVVQPKGRV